MQEQKFSATGRRKESTVRAILVPGKGSFRINGSDISSYLKRQTLVDHAQQPLVENDLLGTFDISCNAKGGGLSGQAGAVRLAIARALLIRDPELRGKLKAAGFLTRDAREVERKKYGQPKARKRFQYSKR